MPISFNNKSTSPTFVDTQGSPTSIASASAFGKPSRDEWRQKTSIDDKQIDISVRSSIKFTFF